MPKQFIKCCLSPLPMEKPWILKTLVRKTAGLASTAPPVVYPVYWSSPPCPWCVVRALSFHASQFAAFPCISCLSPPCWIIGIGTARIPAASHRLLHHPIQTSHTPLKTQPHAFCMRTLIANTTRCYVTKLPYSQGLFSHSVLIQTRGR